MLYRFSRTRFYVLHVYDAATTFTQSPERVSRSDHIYETTHRYIDRRRTGRTRFLVCPYRLRIAQPVICHLLYPRPRYTNNNNNNNNKIVNNSPVPSYQALARHTYHISVTYYTATIVIAAHTLSSVLHTACVCVHYYNRVAFHRDTSGL
jgi:hypothetical protein